MKLTAVALAHLCLMCSCTTNPSPPPEPHHQPEAISLGVIRGVVVDEAELPTEARVALVTPAGSRSMGIGRSGVFEFTGLEALDYVVTATSGAGRISVLPGIRPGREFELPPLSQGGTIIVEMNGRPSSRLAVQQGDVRVHDITLREGKPVEVVVPAGDLVLRLYGDGVEQLKTVSMKPGGEHRLAFNLDS